MMYKRFLVLFAVFLVGFSMKATKAWASQTDTLDADVLLVYNDNPSDQDMDGLKTIIRILTYMQRSVYYTGLQEGREIYDQYDYVICYNLQDNFDNEVGEFMKKLEADGKEVFIIGGDGIEDYITAGGYDIRCTTVERSKATVSYRFTQGEARTAVVYTDKGTFLDGAFDYQNGQIQLDGLKSSLFVRAGNFEYMPFSDVQSPVIEETFISELALWLWPYKDSLRTYEQYIILDELYAFIPPESLMEIIDYMTARKMPFVLSVMPIYENGDYPAMQRFCDILRYAQAHGGTIIMHTPITQQNEDNIELIGKYLSIAIEAYANYGVYCMGIEAPDSFIFNQNGRDILKRYSSVFFYNDNKNVKLSLSEHFNQIYKDGHFIIGLTINDNKTENSLCFVYPTALYLKASDELASIKASIDDFIKTDIPVKNLMDMNNSVYGDNLSIYSRQGQVFYNDKRMSLDYEPPVYTDFDYRNTVFQRIAGDLGDLNKVLIILVIGSATIFILFIIIARRANRNKFLRKKEE